MPVDKRIAEMTLEELKPYLIKRIEQCCNKEFIDFVDWEPWEKVREEHKSKFAFLLYLLNELLCPDLKVFCLLFGSCDDDKAFFAFTDRAEYEKFIRFRWPFKHPSLQE